MKVKIRYFASLKVRLLKGDDTGAKESTVLKDGDEVAFFPPVTGG